MDGSTSHERSNPFKRQLSEQLRSLLKEHGKSEQGLRAAAQLAGSPIGKGTLNQALNPEHPSIPSVKTLDAICTALGVQPTSPVYGRLAGLRDRAQDYEAPAPSPLHRYLVAADAAVPEHPYSPVRGRKAFPGLIDVYVRQQARRRLHQAGGGPSPEGALRLEIEEERDVIIPADRVFLQEAPLCVLLAGPGGGKSTLLRHHRALSVGRWLRQGADAAVPVLVRAGALTNAPLHKALAQAANVDVRASLPLDDDLPDTFFSGKPHPWVSWLVLVDAFDEISDSESRRRVLDTITRISKQHSTSYRFVVASRSLPDGELEALGDDVPRFWLEPFTATGLRKYAERCFAPLGDSRQHAATLIAKLDHTRLAELARTPLMAYMLCQLYLTDPDRFPPDGRSAVYEEFVAQLRSGDEAKDVSEGQRQAVDALGRNGGLVAERWAVSVIEQLPQLIEHLAYARLRQGDSASAIDVLPRLGDEAVARYPTVVTQRDRRLFLREILRHSSLLVEYPDGDFGFPHLTIAEYLAGRHATRNLQAASQALGELSENIRRDDIPGGTGHQDPSYLGFVLDQLLAPGNCLRSDVSRMLQEAATGRDLRVCLFIADQAQRGTLLPAPVAEATTRALEKLARGATTDGADRVRAAEALTWLSEDSGETLAEIISDSRLEDDPRCQAAVALTRLDGQIAARALAGALGDPSLRPSARVEMAESLLAVVRNTALGRHIRLRAADALDHFARTPDPQVDGVTRIRAAEALARIDSGRAADVLDLLARDANITVDRVRAAEGLVTIAPARGVHVLDLLAHDRSARPFERVQAAEAMIRPAPRQAANAFDFLVSDHTLGAPGRARAGQNLARIDPRRALAALDLLARDGTLDASDRVRAGEALVLFDPKQAVRALVPLARAEHVDSLSRVRAAEAIMEVDPDQVADILTDFLSEAPANGSVRLRAAKALTRLLRAGILSRSNRLRSIEALDQFTRGSDRSEDALARLLAQWSVGLDLPGRDD
ncbi:hypothetical protein OOK48_17850 [Streptomyces viridodiastaticus]|uniref:NACHT domain-containing protein n=1 Tax=Streptomyces albogriseolus TaxID=1887 RepID=UPI00225906DD|nr:hypothetical protein [Streptomyces viridodiastaticus]MCX4568193.1 hypothetical protein [Streptomyces viridodiastaticus]